jgi:hypothetical protein
VPVDGSRRATAAARSPARRRRAPRAALLTSATPDESVRLLAEEIAPALAQLGRIVDEHLPPGTPEEAVEYALTHASGFDVSSVLEYCGADEGRGGDPVAMSGCSRLRSRRAD